MVAFIGSDNRTRTISTNSTTVLVVGSCGAGTARIREYITSSNDYELVNEFRHHYVLKSVEPPEEIEIPVIKQSVPMKIMCTSLNKRRRHIRRVQHKGHRHYRNINWSIYKD